MFRKYQAFETKNWAVSGELPISLHGMPAAHRVKHFLLTVEGTITKSSATDADVTHRDIIKTALDYVKLVTSGFEIDLKGYELYDLVYMVDGKPLEKGTVTVPGSGSTTFRVKVAVPIVDLRHAFPYDTAQGTELFNGKSFLVKCGSTATVTTNITISATTVQLQAFYVVGNGGKVPAKVVLKGLDWSGKEPRLDDVKGTITHLMFTEADGSLSLTDITTVTVLADGAEVLPVMNTHELLTDFNRNVARSEADELDGTFEFFPVLFPEPQYNLTKLPAGAEFVVKFTGSGTSSRLVSRTIQLVGQDEAVRMGKQLGLDVGAEKGTQLVAATGSKTPVSNQSPPARQAFLASLLPKRLFNTK